MNIKDYIIKTDKFIKIIPPEGYIIKNNKTNTLHYKVFCPLQADTSIYSFCEVVNEEDVNNKILQSKNNLAVYLEEHPLLSCAKYPEGRYYNVTLEKQNLLLANISTYQMSLQAGIPCPLTWNDTGKECEVWSFEQLLQLSIEIRNYVLPLTSLQQYMESELTKCKTKEELNNINIEFTKESIENFQPIYLKKFSDVK